MVLASSRIKHSLAWLLRPGVVAVARAPPLDSPPLAPRAQLSTPTLAPPRSLRSTPRAPALAPRPVAPALAPRARPRARPGFSRACPPELNPSHSRARPPGFSRARPPRSTPALARPPRSTPRTPTLAPHARPAFPTLAPRARPPRSPPALAPRARPPRSPPALAPRARPPRSPPRARPPRSTPRTPALAPRAGFFPRSPALNPLDSRARPRFFPPRSPGFFPALPPWTPASKDGRKVHNHFQPSRRLRLVVRSRFARPVAGASKRRRALARARGGRKQPGILGGGDQAGSGSRKQARVGNTQVQTLGLKAVELRTQSNVRACGERLALLLIVRLQGQGRVNSGKGCLTAVWLDKARGRRRVVQGMAKRKARSFFHCVDHAPAISWPVCSMSASQVGLAYFCPRCPTQHSGCRRTQQTRQAG